MGGKFYNDLVRIEQDLPLQLSRSGKTFCFEYPQFRKILDIILFKIPLFEKVTSNLYIYHSIGFPFGRSIPTINRLNHFINYLVFNSKLNKLITKNYKLKIISFTPEIIYIFPLIKKTDLIYYYIIDNYISLPFWKNKFQRNQFCKLEHDLTSLNVKIITASLPLYSKYKKLYTKVIYFPTPSDFGKFKLAISSRRIPKDLFKIKRPIVGFIGSMDDWRLDMNLLIKALKFYPKYNFVFIGTYNIKNDKYKKIIKSFNNFYFLGFKRNKVLFRYINNFDVCIIPYKINDFGHYAYPAKINEYLISGKPIVTTALPAIEKLFSNKIIYWSKNSNLFINNIQEALRSKNNLRLIKKRKVYGVKSSWKNNIYKLLSYLNE